MLQLEKITFADNAAVRKKPAAYFEIMVRSALIIESYRLSLFSYEWLTQDGTIKSGPELPEKEREKQREIEYRLQTGTPLEKPVLGIGLLENIEFGAGRAEFLTLTRQGLEQIPVHILKNQKEDFQAFLAQL